MPSRKKVSVCISLCSRWSASPPLVPSFACDFSFSLSLNNWFGFSPSRASQGLHDSSHLHILLLRLTLRFKKTMCVWWYSMWAIMWCVSLCSLSRAQGFDGWCVTSVWSQPFGGDPAGLEDALVSLYFTAYLFTPLPPRCAPPLSLLAYVDRLTVWFWNCIFLKTPLKFTLTEMWCTDVGSVFAPLGKSNENLKMVCWPG